MEQQRLIAARKAVQKSRRASEGGAQSIDRAATLLLLVGRAGVLGARLSDLVAQSDLSKPTVRRILLALARSGLLDQDQKTRSYHLGPEVYTLGMLASTRFGIHSIAMRSLLRLSEQSGDTAFLSVPHDIYSICLHRQDGSYPIRVQALEAGDRHPLGVGAGSLAMLAAMSDANIGAIVDAHLSDGLTERYPKYTAAILMDMVKKTRARGFALNPGMMLAGSWAVGVAIRGTDGLPVGAISIAAIEPRMTSERQRDLVPLLQIEAKDIENRLTKAHVGLHQKKKHSSIPKINR